jgi:hypothetical protein
MRKYGSLIVFAAMFISAIAYADIPIVHAHHKGDVADDAKSERMQGQPVDENTTRICGGGPALVHCEVGQNCNLSCEKKTHASATTKNANRKTAATTDSSGQ